MLSLMLVLVACDHEADAFRPKVTDVPGVQDLGVLNVVTAEQQASVDTLADPSLAGSVYYGRLGAVEDPQGTGGATFQFAGTGGQVCVVVDPEAVFWNYAVGADVSGKYQYRDQYDDDGDIDLSVGLSAYYTGSPGVEIGDFEAHYTDPSGVDHTLEFNECVQAGFQGTTDVHAGRATVEYCQIDTATRAGVMYTVLLETFSLPIDDSILSYGVAVLDGPCGGGEAETYSIDECLLPDELTYAEPDQTTPEGKEWFPELEAAFCQRPNKVNQICEDWINSADYVEGEGPCDDPGISGYDGGDTTATE